MELKETAERMAELSPKKGPTHHWWGLAEAVLAVYDAQEHNAISIMEEVFERRTHG